MFPWRKGKTLRFIFLNTFKQCLSYAPMKLLLQNLAISLRYRQARNFHIQTQQNALSTSAPNSAKYWGFAVLLNHHTCVQYPRAHLARKYKILIFTCDTSTDNCGAFCLPSSSELKCLYSVCIPMLSKHTQQNFTTQRSATSHIIRLKHVLDLLMHLCK